ncbi:MAG: Asp-tRNA(Asn)/Glu-tRNA(Gln) amidotransferase subunit GatA [Candidatus Paceibacterota bacterium]
MIDLKNLTTAKAHESLKKGDYTVRELAEAYLTNIKERNKELNVFLEVFDDILEQAEIAQKRFSDGSATLLTGIPVAIKDNILIQGRKVSSASKILLGYTATYDATVITKLKNEGVVFMGRTNMDEFAMGGSTENSAFGVTKNPLDSTRVPGGSSGGSAASVAMNGALVALGSDTGGSIRQPGSFCGVVGLKPTYGSVSRNGLIAMGSSLDVIGPLTRTIDDAKIVFNAIRGSDAFDSTTLPDSYYDKKHEKKKIVVGIPKEIQDLKGVSSDVLKHFEETKEKLKKAGVEIKEVSLKQLANALACYYIIMPAEVSSNLGRFDGFRFGTKIEGETLLDEYVATRGEGFGSEARRRIILGTYVLSAGYYDAYYGKAEALRALIKKDFQNAFEEVSVIMTPTVPSTAFKIGEKSEDPLSMYAADMFTVPANLAGVPAISVTTGFDSDNMPFGTQFIAPHTREDLLFEAGSFVSI